MQQFPESGKISPILPQDMKKLCRDVFPDFWQGLLKDHGEGVISCGIRDQTKSIHQDLSTLKPNTFFWDISPNINPGHLEPHRLLGSIANSGATLLTKTRDLIPFISGIKDSDAALQLVRFFSKTSQYWSDFKDEKTTYSELGTDVEIVDGTRAELEIGKPKTRETIDPTEGHLFLVERLVVTGEQINHAIVRQSNHTPSGGYIDRQLQLSEFARVTETVSTSGAFSFSIRKIPVKDFVIKNRIYLID